MLKNNQKDQRFKTVLRRMWYLIVTEFISAAPKGKKIKKPLCLKLSIEVK